MWKRTLNRLARFSAFLALALFLPVPAALGQAHVGLPFDEEGSINGSPYKIRVPVNWNGTLLAFAHGYRDKADHPGEVDNRTADVAPGGAALEGALLAQGYALAGSAFKENGWAIKEGVQNTLALTNLFKGRVGKPDRIILWGVSLGSVVTLKSIEKYPGIYDGAIPACTVGAGGPRTWDGALAVALAYDVTFGWLGAWGQVGDVRDDLDFETEVAPVMVGQFFDPSNFGLLEFIRLVNGIPSEDVVQWPFSVMFFVTEGRSELERRARGPVAQNLDHVYSLSSADIAYLAPLLAPLGLSPDTLLTTMNARRNIFADRNARNYIGHYADYTGNIKRPVLSIHTAIDGLVPVSNESVYRATVQAAGKENLLVQVFTDSVGHCAFNALQLFAVIQAMEFWLQTGTPPGATFFPAALGFIPGFVPPPWPYE